MRILKPWMAGVGLAALLLLSMFALMTVTTADPPTWAEGAETAPFEEVDPGLYQLEFSNSEEVLNEVNEQLGEMSTGGILEIDAESPMFKCVLVENYLEGNVLYWTISDHNIKVNLLDETGEIISYQRADYASNSLSEQDAISQAENIAYQFLALPNDASSEETHFTSTSDEYKLPVNPQDADMETSISGRDNWYVCWNRTKNSVICDDVIFVILEGNGNLSYYNKVWWMDIEGLNTSPGVSQGEAETAAEDFTDANVVSSVLRIKRPNDFWGQVDEDYALYGTAPTLVWEVVLITATNDTLIVYVNAQDENDITGGDYMQGDDEEEYEPDWDVEDL